MNQRTAGLLALLLIALMIVLALAQRPSAALAVTWQQKVDPWVLETAATGETEFLVFLAEQADLSAAGQLQSRLQRGSYVYETLTAVAERTQGPLLDALADLDVEHRAYWVANMIWARGDLAAIMALAARDDVAHLYANPWVRMEEPTLAPAAEDDLSQGPEAIEWNILRVNADDVWAAGFTGQGAVIGGQDTGYDWDHPALINQYRGWNGGTADHNYSWHDAIHLNNPNTPPGNPCGFDSPVPCDDHGHGTHTVGTMVGDDGGANQIGMAPGARWIGCRNMEQGWGTPTTYSECYQWFIAPTDLNGQNPDPAMAPDAISNSWGCPAVEGCTDPNVMLAVVNNVRAAGILTAHSAGNSGSACGTVNTPAGIYDASYTVGSTDSSDNISGFSSRGPVTLDGSNRLKPDISAPGSGIRSSYNGGGYATLSGTSMASPHVAGLVALLISVQPGLAGQVDALEQLINQTALPRTTTQSCGGVPGDQIPNNTYGHGRIDAFTAYLHVPHFITLEKTVSNTQIEPGGLLTYTLSISHLHPLTATHNVVLTDTIPTGTTFVTATVPFSVDNLVVEWDPGTLAAGAGWTGILVVQVAPDASGVVSNELYGVRSDDVATILGPAVHATVVPFSLELFKSVSAAEVETGALLTYTLTLTNPHPVAATTNVFLGDAIPAGTTFVTATLPHTFDGTSVTWQASSLPPQANWSVLLVVQVTAVAPATITNDDYYAASDQVTQITGPPVVSTVVEPAAGQHFLHLPALMWTAK